MAECLEAFDQHEQRLFQRIETDSVVYILLGEQRPPLVRVGLKNWSTAGARATLEKGFLLPEEFRIYRLAPDGEGTDVNCKLIWQVGNEAGFKLSMKSKPASETS